MIERTCLFCGNKFNVFPCHVRSGIAKYCSRSCHAKSRIGNKNPHWKGGEVKIDTGGYRKVYIPYGMKPEHVLIMEKNIGRELKENEIVHHIDGNRINNNIENLKLLESQGAHRTEHARQRILVSGGDPDKQKICSWCKKLFPIEDFYNYKRKDGYGNTTHAGYCKKCSNEKHAIWVINNRDKRDNKNGFNK